MMRTISEEEAKKLGAIPVEEEPMRTISAEEAEALGGVPVEDASDAASQAMSAKEASNRARSTDATLGDVAGRFVAEKLPRKIRSALEGFTSNAAPYALAAMEGVKGSLTPGQTFSNEYNRTFPEYQKKYTEAAKMEPGSNLVGAMGQPSPLGKLKAASMAGKLALAGGRIAQAGTTGAVARRLGESGGNESALDGALPAAAVQAGLEAMSPLAARFAAGLRPVAQSQAIKTLSPSKADIAKINQMGIGEKMADDLYHSKAFGPFSNTADVAERLGREGGIVAQRGETLGGAIGAVDDVTGGRTVSPSSVADRIREMSKSEFGGSPAMRAKAVMANREADAIAAQYGNEALTLADSEQMLKRGYDAEAVKRIMAEARGASPSPKTDALALVREAIKKENEAAAAAASPALGDEFIKAKQGYGRMAEALRIADKTGGPKAANRTLSPSDYGFGIASGQAYGGSALGNAVSAPVAETLTGLLASIAHNQVRTRGNALASTLAYPSAAVAESPLVRYLGSQAATSPAASASLAELIRRFSEKEEAKE